VVDIAVETCDWSALGGSSSLTRVIAADSAAGVAIFESVDSQLLRVGQVDTPGNAQAVALPPSASETPAPETAGLAAVADGTAGLAIIDLSDPVNARILHQVSLAGESRAVTIAGCIAYVGTQSGLVAVVDLFSGFVLDSVDFDFPIDDLRTYRGVLLVIGRLRGAMALVALPIEPGGGLGTPSSPVESPAQAGRRRWRLAAGDGVAYAVHGRGYNTFDLSNPLAPSLVAAGETAQFGWK
jgi:hypothetical protein